MRHIVHEWNRLICIAEEIILIAETAPTDFKNANIVTIFKNGDRSVCGKYRGISLLSAAAKVFARVLLNRLNKLAECILPESQVGFRQERGTADMIFCARQIQEKAREQQKAVYLIFYDLEKAFDNVPRLTLWQVLHNFGCPPRFINLIRVLHDDMKGCVCFKRKTF